MAEEEHLEAQEASETLAAYRNLVKSQGWALHEAWIKEQYENRVETLVLTPAKGMDGALESEYTKGECAMLMLLLKQPGLIIEDAQDFLDAFALKDEGE